jgi:dCMP deaminase
MDTVLVLYIPVLHRGYLDFFLKHHNTELYLLDPKMIKEFFPLHQEIRALDPGIIKKMIEALGVLPRVSIISDANVSELKGKNIISADEEVSRKFIAQYLSAEHVIFDNVFLRWDEGNVKRENAIHFDRESSDAFDREIMQRASHNAGKSSDWWRHVGAVLVKDQKSIFDSHNHHVPSEHVQYINGDPRDSIKAGENPEYSTALHAEQKIVIEAARKGIALEGSSIYVTAFPCMMCAKLIAFSGIKKVFFETGSAVLDGERVLKANGVELILVK